MVTRPVTDATGRWCTEGCRDLPEREETVLEQRAVYTLQTVDDGKVVALVSDHPVEAEKSAIRGSEVTRSQASASCE